MLRFAKYFLSAVILLIAALFAGAMPLPVASADDGDSAKPAVRIYVLSNGFHSDIAIPRNNDISVAALGVDETDFTVDLDSVEYWAIGWGSITAYTSLMAVSDLTISIAAKALAFDDAVMHITPLGALKPSERVYAFDLTAGQYRNLIDNLTYWFVEPTPMDVSQGFGDRFYAAKGRFAPWYTCNTWTGRRLREVGISIGAWTPVSQSLEFGLDMARP